MSRTKGFRWNFFLAVDASRYSQGDDQRQHANQRALLEALNDAAEDVGLDRSCWEKQQAGDSEFALLPNEEPAPLVVDEFVRALDDWLERYNDGRVPDARLRLRVAMHHGGATPADNGFAGREVVTTQRLLDSSEVRTALDLDEDANLSLIISARVFEAIVRQRHTSLRPEDFVQVHVRDQAKGFEGAAWVRVPRVAPERLARAFREHSEAPRGLVLAAIAEDVDALHEAVNLSFASVQGQVDEIEDSIVIVVPNESQYTKALGVCLEQLRELLDQPVYLGVAMRDTAQALELADSDLTHRTLDAAHSSRLVVSVSEQVYQQVVSKGGRKVSPNSYVRGAGGWVRVPGYSMPPVAATSPRRRHVDPPPSAQGGPHVYMNRAKVGTQVFGTMNQYGTGEAR
ncbi:hypothetical protein [Kutzneria albida]|uniref:Uncharacterized protein n=1 Tax=Kutzneria albida DSM 43870 TaxID=1449976 RepID=W5WIJ2_9PSEU|nr:hypothetical protein [Kutzneria albida]AHI01024.1 hypothetical protein KALB_7666 [Kutzneria albida DSM 43870]